MVFINKGPEGYQPFGPVQPNLDSNVGRRPVTSIQSDDNLFDLCPEREITTVRTITDYQEWAETGWKTKHGTYEAADRFVGKMFEESHEVSEAYLQFIQSGSNPESEQATELLSELGDVLWCATATASNSSADIDAAMKVLLYGYTMGVEYHDDHWQRMGVEANPWRDTSGRLAIKPSDLTLSEISDLMTHDFEPLQTPARNIGYGEPDYGMNDHIQFLSFDAMTLRGCVGRQYTYGETEDEIRLGGSYDALASSIATIVAGVYLDVAYIAANELGATLDDVVAKNMQKLSARIKAKRVDKTDGPRDAELK